ncbi:MULTISPECIES: hypothetical protein [Bacillaceae]|uniref:DUF2178 domain-containing protein n=2 Tax=Bacillus infantis TaxID=324767 RepID=U5L6R8_9BACI|nr:MULTISPECIES: hypothetical protein [Bacillus]OXT17545.1 hypothetical protein B9K06_09520 [Bacillus sp. OG2]AGX02446.1 hypothetical protein N288_02395 [Bacillus infantis NRRL B-14911]EAR67445.1 hypothetical protein B14911_18660 [Bacillus sp. NRRL B-14911]MDW2878668.1 hypothetical protein [Bacillus infantis]TYS62254.1 hypothetical protein FZD47_19495 [Bacillus infantis]
MKGKEIAALVLLIAATLYFGGTFISYIKIDGASIGSAELLVIIALLIGWVQFITWGTRKEVQKDEMGRQIIKDSARVSYYVVLAALMLLWIIDFFLVSKGENYTLFIALCIAYITYPIIQYVLVKRFAD